MSSSETVNGFALAIIGALLCAVARSFFDAFVLMTMWAWFVVPLGVVQVHFWHAYGLDLLLSYALVPILARKADKAEVTSERTFALVFTGFLSYVFILGVGYVAHRLMVGS